jgi:hypothetical protein
MEEYVNLILSMIVSYEEYGDEMNFTKQDIMNFINEKDIIRKGRWNERASIVLWRNGYITDEHFAQLMDLEYEDESFWLTIKSFEEILGKCTDADILDGDAEWYPGDFYKVDIEWFWKEYTKETLEAIIEFCIKKGLGIDGVQMTKDNLKYTNDDVYFNDIKLIDLLNKHKYDLDELRGSLNLAVCEAQDAADQQFAYDKIESAFEKQIGEFRSTKWKIKGEDIYGFQIKIDIDWSDIENDLKNHYGDYEFVDEYFGDFKNIMKEFDRFNYNGPDIGNGDINNSNLNEYTRNRLSWD